MDVQDTGECSVFFIHNYEAMLFATVLARWPLCGTFAFCNEDLLALTHNYLQDPGGRSYSWSQL